ncbi:hypothetical protein OG339_37160 [Streptosporangium sp. NBC_01495]|nr:hypothetical protein [Streptosporangium sp. NBC_01495]
MKGMALAAVRRIFTPQEEPVGERAAREEARSAGRPAPLSP